MKIDLFLRKKTFVKRVKSEQKKQSVGATIYICVV